MADVKLSPERWKLLRDYFVRLQPDLDGLGVPDDLMKIQLGVMIDVDGVTFLPAVYRPA